jgi:hypothetical protein
MVPAVISTDRSVRAPAAAPANSRSAATSMTRSSRVAIIEIGMA